MKLLLLSHGPFSQGLKDSCNMIFPDVDSITAIGLSEEKGIDSFKKEVATYLEEQKESVLVMVDILGGTPSNLGIETCASNKNIWVITGMSMPMVFSFLEQTMIQSDKSEQEIVNEIVDSAKKAVNLFDYKLFE